VCENTVGNNLFDVYLIENDITKKFHIILHYFLMTWCDFNTISSLLKYKLKM